MFKGSHKTRKWCIFLIDSIQNTRLGYILYAVMMLVRREKSSSVCKTYGPKIPQVDKKNMCPENIFRY